MKIKGYLGNGLFSLQEQLFNKYLAGKLRKEIPELELYVPQENTEINDKSNFADSVAIAVADYERLQDADFLIACLDGVLVDPGLATEIGDMLSMGKPVFGLYTDVRQQKEFDSAFREKTMALIDVAESQWHYVNLYTVGRIKMSEGSDIFTTVGDLVEAVKNYRDILEQYDGYGDFFTNQEENIDDEVLGEVYGE